MKTTPFRNKIFTCLVAGLTVAALVLVLGNSGTLPWFPPLAVFSLVGLSLLSALIGPFLWQWIERRQTDPLVHPYAFLFAVIRYSIAFNLASFGWKKIFGLQFIVPTEIAAQPMNQLSGEDLTWYYFGYSPTFGTLLALTQIVGAYGLLFRKTFLLSSVVLFALMLNITLVNVFYQMNAGALLQSVVLTLGLVFLLSTERKQLITMFMQTEPRIPAFPFRSVLVKNAVKLSAVTISLLFVYFVAKP